MNSLDMIVNFFKQGGAFLYPIAAVFAVGLGFAVERFIYLTRVAKGNRRLWAELAPLIQAGNFRKAMEVAEKQRLGALDRHALRHVAHRDRPPSRGHREGDGGEPDRGHPAAREAHALPRHARQRRHADGPARHRHRPDQRLRRRRGGEPGGEGRDALGEHLGGDEQHGARPRTRDHAAALPTCTSRPRPRSWWTASRWPRSSSSTASPSAARRCRSRRPRPAQARAAEQILGDARA